MPVPQPLPSRLIGALFVERGLVSESQIRIALEIQNETGQQLGQILVERFGVSRKELASVVAEQWAKLGGSAGPEDTASWRRLGEIFVDRGFVSQDELEGALARQRQTGERLGEALVAQGVISKFELAGALAEQMAALEASDAAEDGVAEATVHHLPARPEEQPDIALELLPSEHNGFGPAEAVEATAEPHEHAAVEEKAEPAPDDLEQPEAAQDDVFADVGSVEHADESVIEAVPFGEPPADDAALDELLVESVALAEPPADDVALAEPPADDVGIDVGVAAEPPADDVASAEPMFVEVAFEEPVLDDVVFEEPFVDDVVFEPAVDDAKLERPVVDEVPISEPAVACVAFAPTTTGYRLVPLDAVPAPAEMVDVPEVGLRLVLRVGRAPDPRDDRVCAYVEEPVVWALAIDVVH